MKYFSRRTRRSGDAAMYSLRALIRCELCVKYFSRRTRRSSEAAMYSLRALTRCGLCVKYFSRRTRRSSDAAMFFFALFACIPLRSLRLKKHVKQSNSISNPKFHHSASVFCSIGAMQLNGASQG